MSISSKIFWVIFTIVVILAIILVSTSKPSPTTEGETIKIGAILNITGKGAPYGEQARMGAELAISDINEENNKKVELILEDSKSELNSAITSYQFIKSKIKSFISIQSGIVLTLSPLANQDEIILFNIGAMSPDIRKAGDYVFSNINDSNVEVKQMAKFVKEIGLNKIAIFYENDEAGVSAKKIFIEEFKNLGGDIAIEENFSGQAFDVKTQLLKIKEANPQGVYLPAFPENVALVLEQAKEMNFETKWFSWNVESNVLLKSKNDIDLIYSVTALDLDNQNPTPTSFSKKFQDRYDVIPNIYAATAYDGINLLYQAETKTNGSVDEIKNYLYAVEDYIGVSGNTTFDSDGMSIKPVMFKTVKDGQFVPYEQ